MVAGRVPPPPVNPNLRYPDRRRLSAVAKPLRLASGLALAVSLAFAAPAAAQDDIVGQVEQALHDDAAAAYEAVASFLGDVESSVSDATSGALDTAQADLGALEARLGQRCLDWR